MMILGLLFASAIAGFIAFLGWISADSDWAFVGATTVTGFVFSLLMILSCFVYQRIDIYPWLAIVIIIVVDIVLSYLSWKLRPRVEM